LTERSVHQAGLYVYKRTKQISSILLWSISS